MIWFFSVSFGLLIMVAGGFTEYRHIYFATAAIIYMIGFSTNKIVDAIGGHKQ